MSTKSIIAALSAKQPTAMTAEEFFAKGYAEKNQFAAFYERLSQTDYQWLEDFFEALESKLPINNGNVIRIDPSRNPYVFADVKYKMGVAGLKVPIFGEVRRFIKDYQMGKITIGFTLEDLYNAAVSDGSEQNDEVA